MSEQPNYQFDARAATEYNQSRAHPPEVSQRVGAAIAEQIGTGQHALEIGVGTGRIAFPVARAGCRVTGIDLSGHMLQDLWDDPALYPMLRLARADMHRLPFADAAFDAVLAVHVLHLSQDVKTMLAEIARVLKADGKLIQGDDWIDPQSCTGMIRNELRAQVMRVAPDFIPPSALLPRDEILAELGGPQTRVDEQIVAEWTTYASPADRLQAIEQRKDPESWVLGPDLFEKCVAHLRTFAAETWHDLEAQQTVTRRFILKITHGAW